MTNVWSRAAGTLRRQQIRGSGTRMLLLLAIGVAGTIASSSSAHATALTVSGAYLRYINQTPSILFGAGGEKIDFGATNVMPNSLAGTTGVATTKNLSTRCAS